MTRTKSLSRPDGPFSQAVYSKELNNWMDHIATQEEREKVVSLLSSLDKGTEKDEGGQDSPATGNVDSAAGPAALNHLQHQGWTHTSTRYKQRMGSSRPQTASGGADRSADKGGPEGMRPQSAPQTRSPPRRAYVGSPLRPSSVSGSLAAPEALSSMSVTQTAHGLSRLYPHLYEEMMTVAVGKPAANKTFVSEWGDALKARSEETWRPFLLSTYQANNHQVFQEDKQLSRSQKEAEILRHMGQQHQYSRDLFTPSQCAQLEQVMGQSSPKEARALLDTLSKVHAAVDPTRFSPTSHLYHRPMIPSEDPQLTQLIRTRVKTKARGTARDSRRPAAHASRQLEDPSTGTSFDPTKRLSPRHVLVPHHRKGPLQVTATLKASQKLHERHQSTDSLALSSHCTEEASSSPQPSPGSAPSSSWATSQDPPLVGTFTSHVPMKWGGDEEATTPLSAYQTAFGKLGAQGSHRVPGAADKQDTVQFREVNVSFGGVDPHLHPPLHKVFMMSDGSFRRAQTKMTNTGAMWAEKRERVGLFCTTNDVLYPERAGDPQALAEGMRSSLEFVNRQGATLRASQVPLHHAGDPDLNLPSTWSSEYTKEFDKTGPTGVQGNHQVGQNMKAVFTGPTAPVGAALKGYEKRS